MPSDLRVFCRYPFGLTITDMILGSVKGLMATVVIFDDVLAADN